MTAIWRSWQYCHDSFADDLEELQQSGDLQRESKFQRIWQTKQKYVLKITTGSGKTAAFKEYDRIKSAWKYLFRLSPCGSEALNYQLLANIDIALPRLLAAGDIRKNGCLKNAFIITEFAEGFRDGRDFFGTGSLAENIDLREEFITRNMRTLAKLHDHNILHRGFTPANLLYKQRKTADADGNRLDLMWIDVASCRNISKGKLEKTLHIDHEQFFRFFDFSSEELKKYLQIYCQAAENPLTTPEKLLERLQKAIAKRHQKEAQSCR